MAIYQLWPYLDVSQTLTKSHIYLQSGAPKIAKLDYNSNFTMVYSTQKNSTSYWC